MHVFVVLRGRKGLGGAQRQQFCPREDDAPPPPPTKSDGDNALNPVDAARLLPHSGRRERKELQDTVRVTRTIMELSWQ